MTAPIPVVAPSATAAVDEPVEAESVVAGPCDTDIAFNEVISCDVTSPGQVRDLDFPGAAGDQVRVRVVATSPAPSPRTGRTR